MKIAIGAGHGINTPGKRTPDGMKEFEFNSVVAEVCKDELLKYENVQVLFVHDPRGYDVPLKDRTDKANEWEADLYLSIHANAFGDGEWNNVRGLETYIYDITPQSTRNIAKVIHETMIEETKQKDRGLKSANFHVLRETKMSAVLVEHGFMTNKEDAELLKSRTFREICGKALAKAIVNYYNLTRKELEDEKEKAPEGKLYKVQTGAFMYKENADKLLERLKEAGFEGFIKIE